MTKNTPRKGFDDFGDRPKTWTTDSLADSPNDWTTINDWMNKWTLQEMNECLRGQKRPANNTIYYSSWRPKLWQKTAMVCLRCWGHGSWRNLQQYSNFTIRGRFLQTSLLCSSEASVVAVTKTYPILNEQKNVISLTLVTWFQQMYYTLVRGLHQYSKVQACSGPPCAIQTLMRFLFLWVNLVFTALEKYLWTCSFWFETLLLLKCSWTNHCASSWLRIRMLVPCKFFASS